jgi:drug/metabolite transporter (DMT)-like permease
MNDQLKGAALMVGAFLLGAIEMALVHGVGDHFSSLQLAFLRSVGSGALLTIVVLLGREPLVVRSSNLKIQLMRGFFSAAGLWALIYTFAHMPLIDATALTYTRALFMTVFAALFLREHVRRVRWLGTIAGLVGAALVIQPAFSDPSLVYLVGIAAPALNAAMQVSTKFAVRVDAVNTTMFWIFAISFLAFSPSLASEWHWPGIDVAVCIGLIAILGPLATYMSLWAMHFADVSMIAPFDYTRLIVNTLIALILFREMPTPYGWLGMAIIVAGCIAQTTRAYTAATPSIAQAGGPSSGRAMRRS